MKRGRTVIAAHLILTLYGHWAVNDPRGSWSTEFLDPKFEPLGPIHYGRKPEHLQPSRARLREFHAQHGDDYLNYRRRTSMILPRMPRPAAAVSPAEQPEGAA